MKKIIILLAIVLSLPLFADYSSLTKSEKSQIIWSLQKAKIYNDLAKGNYTNIIKSKLIKADKTNKKLTSWYKITFIQYPNSNPNDSFTNILVVPVITEIKTKSNFWKYIIAGVGGGLIGALIAK